MTFTRRSKLLRRLEWRGLIADISRPLALDRHLAGGSRAIYVGFDPTADSLHVGSLLPLLALRRVQRAGHRPIILIGGGTGLIGDPSGKTGERVLNPRDQVAEWSDRLRRQAERFVDFDAGEFSATVVDNYEWLSKLRVIAFLRSIGKHFSLGTMLAKESVRSRMGKSDAGISYTEFSYQILQAYDFRELFRRHGCTVQFGGSDQWGNITAGIDLIRRTLGKAAYGLTLPLVTKADGTKFGKTESGTVWLDAGKTSAYEMYQFWINTADADVVRYLKYFTFLPLSRIRELEAAVDRSPEKREAQRQLARDVTAIVHGAQAMEQAEAISLALFSGDVRTLSADQLAEAARLMPSTEIPRDEFASLSPVDVLVRAGVASSRRVARELVAADAIQWNGTRLTGPHADVRPDALHGRYVIIRRGKRAYHAVILTA